MNELTYCIACEIPLRLDTSRDEMVCIMCGNAYGSEMMYDGQYDQSPDSEINSEVFRALRTLQATGLTTPDTDVEEIQREARDVFRMQSKCRKTAVASVILRDDTNEDAWRALRVDPLRSESRASIAFTNTAIEFALDIMAVVDIHIRYKRGICETLKTVEKKNICTPFAMACISIILTVPDVDEKIFRLDPRFTKKIYSQYNE